MKLYAHPDAYQTKKILIAAQYVGLEIESAAGAAATGKIPVLEISQGCVFSSVAIARYVSRISRVAGLYGQNLLEGGAIDSWVEFCTHELEVPLSMWLLPVQGVCAEVPEATRLAKEDVKKALSVLDKHLLHNTYMVGHQITLADISVCCAVVDGLSLVLDADFRKPYPNFMRWFDLCMLQPEFAKILGKVQLCCGVTRAAAPKREAAPKKELQKETTPKKDAAPKKEAAPKKGAASKKEAAPEKESAPKKEAAPKKGAKKEVLPAEEGPTEKTPEELAEERKKQLKKVVKEGGKRGVEIEGAADMGGLQFFCTSVDEPQGDLEFLLESVNAMNAKSDPTEEERKGGSGHIGKMVFSAGSDQLAVVAYVPEAKQGELACEEWLDKVLSLQPGGKVTVKGKELSSGSIPTDADRGVFPLKIREGLILEANNFLRSKGLFPDGDDDEDDEMVFGDDDFPS